MPPDRYQQSTECDQVIVGKDDVWFTAYPRHVDWEQRSQGIPWSVVREAANEPMCATCAHKAHEDCLICSICGECKESLDEHDVCDECREA